MKNIFFLFLIQLNSLSAQITTQDSLRLLFAGDIMNHIEQIKSAELIENKEYNFDPCFQYVKPIIENADLAIGNLELTLPGTPPYSGYPVFKSPDQLADALKRSGFDVLVTANNHSNDSGSRGLKNTIKTLKTKGFLTTGTYSNAFEKELYHPLIIYKNGFKLALLNYTFGTNGIPTRYPSIVNTINPKQIKLDLEKVRKISADLTIVFIHWGKEAEEQENAEQENLAKRMHTWGADLIIGSHPHVVQSIKKLKQKNSTSETIVVYSLGNFISNQMQPNTDIGILFDVLVTKENGKASITAHQYIPIWRYIFKPKEEQMQFFTIPVTAFEKNEETLLSMNRHEILKLKSTLQKLRKRLKDSDSSERKISLQEVEPIIKIE